MFHHFICHLVMSITGNSVVGILGDKSDFHNGSLKLAGELGDHVSVGWAHGNLDNAMLGVDVTNIAYEEASLTLQATTYNGKYMWKIPDITRRRRDAVMGKTVSLYSAPFYTDRFGYRMCLCVYLDGDGSGKGHYISFFLTIMKGEYDAVLEWPFQLTVTLTMINQKGNSNIVQSFKPNPNSANFHRPKSDMNVASGCPKFAALSVLDNPEFIVDDVAFFQCVVRQQQVNN